MIQRNNLKLLIPKSHIAKKVRQLANRITNDYKDKHPIFIGILNGAYVFLSDLLREVKLKTEVDFLKLSSYGDRKISSGQVTMQKGLNSEIKGRDIIVVEDIIDSGTSIKYIKDLILQKKPNTLEFATLLYKKGVSGLDFEVKYIGFKIPNKFVVGYGLDYAQQYRNLKSIYVLNI